MELLRMVGQKIKAVAKRSGRFLKTHVVVLVILCLAIQHVIYGCALTVLYNGLTIAWPENSLKNTQWICEIKENGEEQTLHLEFNSSGTILASRERGYELLKKGFKWVEHDYTDINGKTRVITGYTWKLTRSGEYLTIVKAAAFSGAELETWHCTLVEK